MKLSAVLLSTLLLTPLPALADHKRVFTESYCYKNVERYIPGYINERGKYVSGYVKKERKRIPCHRVEREKNYHYHRENNHSDVRTSDDNSCIEGSVLGGIAGGGLGAALSRGDGRWWAIPLGIVGGSMVGCQVDGG